VSNLRRVVKSLSADVASGLGFGLGIVEDDNSSKL